MDKIIRKPLLLLLFCLCCLQTVHAQFTVSGQVRTRTEYRNGQGTPQVKDTIPAIFTSQRTRLNFGCTGYRFKVYTSVQDVRVWGQDAATINRTTADAVDGFMLHEAWAEISLVDTGKVVKNFSVKIGRQELVYDDARLLGNLDWLQQARRHDAAVIKFDHKGWTAHLGAAFNQSGERKSNTIYNGAFPTAPTGYAVSTNGMSNNYKSMQFLYVAKKLHFGNASFLFFKDDFSKFKFAATDVNKTTPIFQHATNSRYTTGFNFSVTAIRKLGFAFSAFYQGGEYRDGTELDEYLLSASAMYTVTRKLSVGSGVDFTSGSTTNKNKRFDPLYGTPHKFWGLMDYFYVADGFGSNGLVDYYFKTKFKAKDNLTLALDAHQFVLPNAVVGGDGNNMEKSLGTELDFVLNYALTKVINIEGGYSKMFSTSTMVSSKVKGTAKDATKGIPLLNDQTASKNSSWAYLMISIKPEFLFKN